MPDAMPEAMPDGCSEESTQRNATNATNERVQDPHKSSSVSDPADPVDKRISFTLGDTLGEAISQIGRMWDASYDRAEYPADCPRCAEETA